MSSDGHYRPRLSVELDDEKDFFKLQALFPHGTQKAFFNVLVKEVITLLEKGGHEALALVLSKTEPRLKLKDCLPSLIEMKGEEDG